MRYFRIHYVLLGLYWVKLCSGATCQVARQHEPSPAESAYLHANYETAISLYNNLLAEKPNDPELTEELSNVLLHQQKFNEANEVVAKALSANPKSAVLVTAAGFAQFRAGTPWAAAESGSRALALDPCNARAHLLESELLHLNSMFKSAAEQLKVAHQLDPYDPEIRQEWLMRLPMKERIQNAEEFLAGANGLDGEDEKHWRTYLEHLKKLSAQPPKPCRLASREAATELPFASLMRDGAHLQAFGLDVKLNNQSGRLQIDTGAGGLIISPSFAKRAGLESFSRSDMGGIGSEGERSAYTAIVDSIRIGGLEFQNCSVEVVKSQVFENGDGLIGMNVFSDMLVTLDYPMHKVILAPLPARPGEAAAGNTTSLSTNADENAATEASGDDAAKAETGAANTSGKTGAMKASTGPYDRYIAPEMKDWSKVYRLGHQLIVRASINHNSNKGSETQKLFILDTGAFSTTISPEAASEVTKLHRDYETKVRGISGKVEKVYTTGDLVFQFANVRQPTTGVFAFDTSNISRHMGIEISGFIGITTLNKLRVTIDYRDALVNFEYDPKRGYRN